MRPAVTLSTPLSRPRQARTAVHFRHFLSPGFWPRFRSVHPTARLVCPLLSQASDESPSPINGKPVARRGRKATGQASRLTAGPPNGGRQLPGRWWCFVDGRFVMSSRHIASIAFILMLAVGLDVTDAA